MMTLDNFQWLQEWYHKHCDGDWEHSKRIHIETIDNPGWSISINLEDTKLEGKKFPKIEIDRSDTDWLFCDIKNSTFEAWCGPNNLPEVLRIFREWAE